MDSFRLEETFGTTIWSPSKKCEVSTKTLSDIEVLVLYIGGVWCGACHRFKELLLSLYEKANQNNQKHLEIIFCQWRGPRPDIQSTPETDWEKYMEDMPWLVLDKNKSVPVQARFGSSFVPELFVLKRESKESDLVTGIWMVTSFVQNFKDEAWPLTKENYDMTQGFYDELIMWPGADLGKEYEQEKIYPRGNLEKIKKILEKKPELVNKPVPEHWGSKYFVPEGWKPVGLYPGVFVADKQIRIESNLPIYPLHLAAGCGYEDVVQYFLERKEVDLEVMDGDGSTPLTYAAFANRPNVIKLLLSKGASKNAVLNISREGWIGMLGSADGYDLVASS